MELKDRIKQARAHLGRRLGRKITQAEFAELCGWPDGQSRIGNYESGLRKQPRQEDIERIAETAGVDLVWLLLGYGEMSDNAIHYERSLVEEPPATYRLPPEHQVTWRLSVTNEGLAQLIAKQTLKRGYLDLRLEKCPGSSEWMVVKSGWQPINTMKAPDPATLLRAIALLLESYTEPALLENNASQRRTEPQE